jgi:Tol biopolymer transport system component
MVALIALFAAALVTAQQKSGTALLQETQARKAAGDLEGAMQGFERVVAEFGATDRNAAAIALLELGAITEQLGQRMRARGYYERVRNDYKDQQAEVRKAEARLAEGAVANTKVEEQQPSKITLKTPYTEDSFSFAISPDGKTLVIQVTTPDGKRQLWRQPVDVSKKPEPIAGSDGAGANALPFFSADGQTVGYFARGKLMEIPLAGGTARELADAPAPGGGSKNKNGVTIFSGFGFAGPIQRAQDGAPANLTTVAGFYVMPTFIDDVRFLYFARGPGGQGRLEIGSLEGGAPLAARGIPAAQGGTFAAGHLLYLVNGRLMAVPFDPQTLTASGAGIPVADQVGREARLPGQVTLSASSSGAIAYREYAAVTRQFLWINREGKQSDALGPFDSAAPTAPRISPDGRAIAFFRQTGTPMGTIWVMDTVSGVSRALREISSRAVWSPDGKRMVFATLQNGAGPALFEQPLNAAVTAPLNTGANAGRFLLPAGSQAYPNDISRNNVLLYTTANGTGDVMALALEGGAPTPVSASQAAERGGRFSPNGAWIAYQSDERGRSEVYVQPFPGNANQRQRVSLSGGSSPEWDPKRQALYFLSADNRLMIATTQANADNTSIEFSTPKALFEKPLPQGTEYAVAPDGERFLLLQPSEDSPPITVLSGWAPKR